METRDLHAPFVRHWEALASAAGATPEIGGRLASFVARLGVEVERAGIDVTEPSFRSKDYEAPVMESPTLRAMQSEIVAFAAENPKHPMLASAAIDAAVGPHLVGELFRPENAPSLDTTRQLVSALERTMRIEGTAISPNDPELTRYVPVGAVADLKEVMTALGLSETQRAARCMTRRSRCGTTTARSNRAWRAPLMSCANTPFRANPNGSRRPM
jgi:hypothetical protein